MEEKEEGKKWGCSSTGTGGQTPHLNYRIKYCWLSRRVGFLSFRCKLLKRLLPPEVTSTLRPLLHDLLAYLRFRRRCHRIRMVCIVYRSEREGSRKIPLPSSFFAIPLPSFLLLIYYPLFLSLAFNTPTLPVFFHTLSMSLSQPPFPPQIQVGENVSSEMATFPEMRRQLPRRAQMYSYTAVQLTLFTGFSASWRWRLARVHAVYILHDAWPILVNTCKIRCISISLSVSLSLSRARAHPCLPTNLHTPRRCACRFVTLLFIQLIINSCVDRD